MHKWQLPGILAGILVVAVAAAAQSRRPEPHFSSASLSGICRGSAFIHGYLHGYEDAFHAANLRLYIPGLVFNPPRIDHMDEKAYRSDFGNKRLFLSGYGYGFGTGYADGISQRSFRALEILRQSFDLKDSPVANRGNDGLDRGLSLGYFMGRKQGLRDGRLREPYQTAGNRCDREQSMAQPAEFCEGLEQGFRMGYRDGYENQYTIPAAQTASR
jgi:hypothetical protein